MTAAWARNYLTNERIFLAAITVGALSLRLVRIGGQSLWVDELLTLEASSPKDGLTIWSYLKYNIHGPLHSFVVYLFQLVGEGDAWLRLPSALAGAGAVAYFYLWTRDWLGHRVARIAAVILAVHPLHIYYSQELRNYSFLLFFGMMSCYYFERLMSGSRRADRVGYVAAIVCAALSNFTAAFLYVTHTALYLLRRGIGRRTLSRWAAVTLVVLVLLSPWVYRIYTFIDVSDLVTPIRPGQLEATERLRGKTTVTPAAVPYAFYTYSVGFSLGPSTRELHFADSLAGVLRGNAVIFGWVAVLFGGLFLWGAWRVVRGRSPTLELFLYLLIPLILTLLLNWQNAKAFNVRYVLVGFPAFVCFIAVGLAGLKRWSGLALALLVLLTLSTSVGNSFFNGRYARDDVRGAVRYVEAHIQTGECVFAPTVTRIVEHYYEGVEEVHAVYNPPGWPREKTDARLETIFAWCNSLWYIRARPWADDADGYVRDRLGQRYRKTQLVNFNGVEVIHFEQKKGDD